MHLGLTKLKSLSVTLVWGFAFAAIIGPGSFLRGDEATVSKISTKLWTTSKVHGSPDPPKPYRAVREYANLKMDWPICVERIPGSKSMLTIKEKSAYAPASLHVFRDSRDVDSATELLRFPGVAYDIAFHPQFQENGYVYFGWNDNKHADGARSQIDRYTMSRGAPYTLDKESLTTIIHWKSAGHNGAAIAFGLDGMLYITSGDGTVRRDTDRVGQRLDTLRSKVLRIDVDRVTDGQTYSIPKDNPFVGFPGAKEETWCYGLRNPWRITVDAKTGHVWVGNNGQDTWEQVYLAKRGANYGWSVNEGDSLFIADRVRGPTPISPPTFNHHHSEARSLTGGIVYYGKAFPDLYGAYLYGDYSTGKIWAAKHDGKRVVEHREIADTSLAITCFAEDRNGELLIADHRGNGKGGFYRLQSTKAQTDKGHRREFPRRLSRTGLFRSTAKHQLADGVLPYAVNVPAWHDGAKAARFVAIPQISADPASRPAVAFTEKNAWNFPDGTVFLQTLTTGGQDRPTRRLESRLLVKQQGEWAGYTYLWDERQDDAVLAPREGAAIDWADGWKAPSRSECMACHSRAANYVLGATLLQLNRDFEYPSSLFDALPPPTRRIASQLDVFEHLGWFALNWEDDDPLKHERLAAADDDSIPFDRHARAYLHANCAHCHVPDGGGNAKIVLDWKTPRNKMNLEGVKPMHGDFGFEKAQLVSPGRPYDSILAYRMNSLGGGRMPRVGSHEVDREGVQLISNWITSLGNSADDVESTARVVEALTDDSERQAAVTRLLGTSRQAMLLADAVQDASVSYDVRRHVAEQAIQSGRPAIRDLFEQFVPRGNRTVRLGPSFDLEVVLSRKGNRQRGRRLFESSTTLACRNCHRSGKTGKQLGPDLSQIAKRKLNRRQLLEAVVQPSKEIDDQFAAYSVLTTNGEIVSGLKEKVDANGVSVRLADGQLRTIPNEQVDLLRRLASSLMPDLLLKDLSAQEAADLLAFLHGLSGDATQPSRDAICPESSAKPSSAKK